MLENQTIRDLLKQHGLRYSKPREAILSYVLERNMHISAEALHRVLRKRGFELSLSTIYLNLGVLKDVGLLRELRAVGEETIYDSNVSEPHYHIVCRRSGKVIDVPPIDIDGVPLSHFLQQKVAEATGWQVEEAEISLRGLAPDLPAKH